MLNPYLISSMLYQEDIWFPDVSMVGQHVHMLESEEEEMWMLVKRNKNIKSVWVRKSSRLLIDETFTALFPTTTSPTPSP